MRIGQGFDAHRFADVDADADESGAASSGSEIVLGGVRIAHSRPLLAHSDGDVLLHALADALLGALALGDIGKHFPDTDASFAGADSRVLLRHVWQLVQQQGYQLGNTDLTIIAQQPRMAAHIEAMRSNIASDLAADIDCVSVKATTTERMGFTGRSEGIAALATVLLIAAG